MRESPRPSSPIWRRPDVYVGLLFVVVAGAGLYIAQGYAMGTAVRMGTGYVPRLLCWVLLALGCTVLLQGLLARPSAEDELGGKDAVVVRPLLFVTAAVVVFAYTIETFGLILSLLATMAVGSFATASLRWHESVIAMAALALACWAIFSYGLALPFPVWPRL